jgi:hypothetical protein
VSAARSAQHTHTPIHPRSLARSLTRTHARMEPRSLVAACIALANAVLAYNRYRFPEFEKVLGEIAREIGFTQVSLSHEVSPLMKLVPRGDTTTVDAYLSPILRRYVDQVATELGGSNVPLMFMQSNGGLKVCLVDRHPPPRPSHIHTHSARTYKPQKTRARTRTEYHTLVSLATSPRVSISN